MRSGLIGFGGWLLLAGILAATPATAAFVAAPMELHLTVPAGEQGTATIIVTNKADRPLVLRAYLGDSRLQRTGLEENLAAGSAARSCAPWVSLESDLIELPPLATLRTTVAIRIPAAAEGSYWTKLYLEEISPPEPMASTHRDRTVRIFAKQRVGIRIYEDVPGTSSVAALIDEVAVRIDEDGTPIVRLGVENTGNTILRCTGTVELRDGWGGIAGELAVGGPTGFVLFPGGGRDLEVAAATPVPPGTYTALAIVDFGGDHLVAGDAVFEIPGSPVVRGADEAPAGR